MKKSAVLAWMTLFWFAAAAATERMALKEKVGDRTIACELAIGDAERVRVAVAPDIDGDGPGISSLVDPEITAKDAGLEVAINANAFRKPDRKDRNWYTGGAAIPYGEIVTNGVYVSGCEQVRLMFWVDATNVCHIGRKPDFKTVREAVSDWGGHFLQRGKFVAQKDVAKYPRSIIGHDATGRRVFLLVGEMTFEEAAEILVRHGASDAMNLDGGGSAVMLPDRRVRVRRPVPVVIGFRK